MAIKLPRLNVGWDVQPGLFARYWNQAMTSIEDNIGALQAAIAAQGTADGAQVTADAAQITADGAVIDAATAQTTADRKVDKSLGPAWTDSSGTASRAAYAAYAGQIISNPPTQAEVQAIDTAVLDIARHLVALIHDLRNNEALTP